MGKIEADTYLGFVKGWRAWGYTHPGYITDVNGWSIWEPGVRNVATCWNHSTVEGDEHGTHDVPVESCQCGFRILPTAPDIRWSGYSNMPIVGEVAGWGGVIKHERGWRVQYAYPQRLIVQVKDFESAVKALERYKVPVLFEPGFLGKNLVKDYSTPFLRVRGLSIGSITSLATGIPAATSMLPWPPHYNKAKQC